MTLSGWMVAAVVVLAAGCGPASSLLGQSGRCGDGSAPPAEVDDSRGWPSYPGATVVHVQTVSGEHGGGGGTSIEAADDAPEVVADWFVAAIGEPGSRGDQRWRWERESESEEYRSVATLEVAAPDDALPPGTDPLPDGTCTLIINRWLATPLEEVSGDIGAEVRER